MTVPPTDKPALSRRSLVLTAAGGAALVVVLVLGVVLNVIHSRSGAPAATSSTSSATASTTVGTPTATASTSSGPTARSAESATEQMDRFAGAPVMQLLASDADPAALATTSGGAAYVLPKATDTSQLVTVFGEKTVQGAIAQLAAIDAAALRNLDVTSARQVYKWAALPGAVPMEQWPLVAATREVQAQLDAGSVKGPVTATYEISGAQVKGVATGGLAAVVCVDGVVRSQLGGQAQQPSPKAAVDCSRMVWNQGRWWIGPGTYPVQPSIVWPNTAAAVRAGWRAVTPSA